MSDISHVGLNFIHAVTHLLSYDARLTFEYEFGLLPMHSILDFLAYSQDAGNR